MKSFLSEGLHIVGQFLLVPCFIVLMALIVVTLWQVGSIVVEYIFERRKMVFNAGELLESLSEDIDEEELISRIEKSKLIKRQKKSAISLINSNLDKKTKTALAQRYMADEENYYMGETMYTDFAMKLGPAFGLLGTLIPLGPGIVALGQGDTTKLAESLGIAFDTTIAGLIVAAISFVISDIRKRWYEDDLITFEAILVIIIEKH